MGIFNSIKKSRRASSDIDEKIEYLNKELEKNGLREAMITTKVYVSARPIENPVYKDFTSAVFNAKPLGLSPSDNTEGLGGAYTGKMVPSEVGLTVGIHDTTLNTKGAALSPLHPVSGKRRYATTRLGGMIGQQFFPTRPGVIQGNREDPTGSVAWLWNPNENNSDGTSGNWYPLEFSPSQGLWGFWDTNFMGFSFLNTNLSQLEFTSGDNTGSSVVSLFNTIGISNKGVVGTENPLVLQKNRIGDAGFLPINIDGLSTQGYRYLKGKAGGLRKRGSGFRTQRGQKLQPFDKGKGGTRKSRQEIRGDAVNKLRGEGDNVGANIFYTKDRIKELEGKESLTYREESELKDLEEYNDWISSFDAPENFVSVSDQQSNFDAAAEEQSNNIFNQMNSSSSTISTTLDEILDSPASSGLSQTERKAISSFSKAIESGEKITPELFSNFESTPEVPTPPTPPKPSSSNTLSSQEFTFPDGSTGKVITTQSGDKIHVNSDGNVVNPSGNTAIEDAKIVSNQKLFNNIDIATSILTNGIVEHKPSEEAIQQFKSNITPDIISQFQFNTERVGYSDGNFNVTYDENGKKIFNPNRDSAGNQGANSPDLSLDVGGNIAIMEHGKPNGQVVLPTDGSEGYVLLEKYAYHNTSSTNPFSKNFDATELPDLGSGLLSGLVHLAANTPAGKAIQAVSDLFSKITGSDSKLPDFLNDYGIHGMAHHEVKVPLSELPADVLAEIKNNDNYDAYEAAQNDKNAAEKYPPPGQSGEHVTPDGGKVKYYNKGIKTSADGSKYMEVLTMPWVEPKEGGEGYYGSLFHPGSYTMKVPLGGAKLRFKGMGKEVYTPKPKPEPPPKPEPDDRKDYEKNRDRQRRFRNSYEPKGNVLSEAAKLGHFEPEVLNVDINDIRKGIMPEFPKDPPPKMVDGYSEKSKLAPKKDEGNPDPFIKITKKDLAKNHMLKDSEIKKFMDEIDSINKYIKENPSELIYAQQRYPKDDPRLAQLNWQMDQMLDAGKEYMDKTFPENKKLFKKIQKSIKKNIELTDPKSFKDVEIPKFEGVNLTDYKRRKEVVSRHFKKAVKIERLFSNKERRNFIKEERQYLNDKPKDNTLKEFMTTTGMYFATRENPAIPAVTAPVPDSTGVLGSGFTPPIGGNGNANDPSNYPAAYDTAWMYNSNDVDGVTNRPIVKTMDQSVIDAYNTAFPDDNRFPSGGAGIVFGDIAFGTAVGYASGGQFIQVLNPGLFGNGSTKIVPPGSPFGAPYFGMFGMYFPATPQLAGVIMGMSGTYMSLGQYNTDPAVTMPVQLWRPHSTFHDGQYDNWSGKKYTDSETNNRYVLQTFYMYRTGNDYVQEPAVPVTTTVLYRNDLGDPGFLPIKIDLGDLSDQGFQYLSDKATPIVKNYSDLKPFEQEILQRGLNFRSGDSWRRELERLQKMYPGFIPRVSIPDDTLVATTDPSAAFSSAPPDAFEPEIGTVELTPADIPDEFKTDNQDRPSAKGVTLTKWMSRADFMKMYPNAITNEFVNGQFVDEYIDALPYGSTDFMSPNPNFPGAWDLNREAYYNYIMTGDLSGLGNSSGIPKPRHQRATPEPKQKMYGEKSYEEVMADLDKTIEKYSTMEKQAYAEMRQIALELGMDFVSLIGGLFTGGTTAAPVLGKLGMKLLKKYGKTVAGKMIRKLIKKFRNKKNSKQMDELLDDIDNADFDQEYDPRKPFEPDAGDQYPNLTRKGEQTYDTATERLLNQRQQGGSDGQLAGKFLDDLVNAAPKGDAALNNVMNKIKKSPIGYLFNSYKPDGKLLSEAAMLGHFEPEQLNVDIEQLRKGIMPEFPEDPPPELINGYSSKSRLAPKKLERSSFIKITKKDLARNHKLKDSEIKDFMNKINAVNDFIKKHPEELVYAQTRYPKSDPRLAQLNWEMDQKLNASKQYMDKHYPENQRLFTKIQKSIKKNVELTDPKSFKGVKTPKFKGVDLTDFKRRKAVVSRHFKKAIRKNKK